jgi:hypothetical protein
VVFEQLVWVVALVAVLIHIPTMWRRVRPHIEAQPELLAGYRRLIYWNAFWMSLPWLVMGVGVNIGGVPTFLNFLRHMIGGPFVWAFWVVLFTEFLLLGYWAIWRGGAETLSAHPGIATYRAHSVRWMKWFLGGMAVFAIVWNIGCLVLIERVLA